MGNSVIIQYGTSTWEYNKCKLPPKKHVTEFAFFIWSKQGFWLSAGMDYRLLSQEAGFFLNIRIIISALISMVNILCAHHPLINQRLKPSNTIKC